MSTFWIVTFCIRHFGLRHFVIRQKTLVPFPLLARSLFPNSKKVRLFWKGSKTPLSMSECCVGTGWPDEFFWKSRPKGGPTNFLSKLLHNLLRGRKYHKHLRYIFVIKIYVTCSFYIFVTFYQHSFGRTHFSHSLWANLLNNTCKIG
jgi:hypothetical protein